MSAFVSGPDEMTLIVGSTQLTNWKTISVSRAVESMPNSFTLTGAEPFPDDPGKIIVNPGDHCQVLCGNDIIVTGFIDRYDIAIGPAQHDVLIQGRGLCQDLVDCSADLNPATTSTVGGMINAVSVLDLAQRLAKPFGITVRSAVDDLGPAIPSYQVALGETSYEIIERAARYAGFLVYEDQNGNLVLDRIGKTSMASGFTVPGNVESAQATRSIADMFSDYFVVWSSLYQLQDISAIGNQLAQVTDATMPRYRPLIMVSEQVNVASPQAVAKQKADWEMSRRRGRSTAINLTADSWRDTAGKLWQPNMLATINAPVLKLVNQSWVIGAVTYRKDASGTHADLMLMPPDAFNPQPRPLQLFDAELTTPAPTSQAPAPPGAR